MSLKRALVPGAVVMTIFTLSAGLSQDGPSAFTFTLFDDAMISMTYARTLVETGEWVWYPGADRVQGFTNPLWTLYLALLHLVGLEGSAAALAVSVTGVALVLGCGVVAGRLVERSLPESGTTTWSAAVAAGVIPLLYPLIFWSVRGMEVGLLALLVLLMIDALDRQRWMRAGWIGACGLATRLDFAVLAGVLSVAAGWFAGDRRTRARLWARTCGPLVLTGLVVLVFQAWYWGDWLTNTYRVKMEGFSLVDRLSRGVLTLAKAAPALILFGWGWWMSRQDTGGSSGHSRVVQLASAALVASVAYAVWVGGDVWEWTGFLGRYVTVALPAGVLVVIIGASRWLQNGAPESKVRPLMILAAMIGAGLGAGVLTNPVQFSEMRALKALGVLTAGTVVSVGLIRWSPRESASRVAIGVLIVATTSGVGYANWITTGGPHILDDQVMARRGKQLADVTRPDAVIATVWAGNPAYYARRPMIDLLGKSDRTIASAEPADEFLPGHNKWNYDDSIGRRQPDVVFQLWREDASLLRQMESWGYEPLCLSDGTPIYVRRSSDRVYRDQLEACVKTFNEVAAMPGRPADQRVAYGTLPDQFGELRLPSGAGPHPVVVLIHGGCWRAEYDITHIAPLATALAADGWAVWAIEYRRVGNPGGGWPGTFQDVGAAIDHLRVLATGHPLDLSRIVAVGHSAGGHLALWSAARGTLPKESPIASSGPLLPKGVVALAGITDLVAYASPNGCGSAVVPLLGGDAGTMGDRYAQASPVTTVPPVPLQLIVGTNDTIVPRSQADALVRVAGPRATVRVVDGAGHFDVIAPEGTAWTALREALRAVMPGQALGQVRGRVFDEYGGSIPDATFSFQPVDAASGLSAFGGVTDARGRFDFEGVRAGTYRVTGRALGYATTVEIHEIRAGVQNEVTIVMKPVK